MRLISRNLILALAVGAFGLTASSGWAMAQPQTNSNHPQAPPGTMNHTYAKRDASPYSQNNGTKVQSVSGTVAKSGNSYVLRAPNGQQYKLTGASRAKSYVGKKVRVTGKVNHSSKSIKVQSIQPQ